ncbi:MAG: hypothetical protein A2Y24_01420 [Clostridiales bacterium GWE2_32_10]|nr:MAG: hypothetical protein A2Y24_01420 [Clostridiales bacterium GWE2_32_10]
MKLYFVRHGQTEWNVEKRIQGSVDQPLNEKGESQARELAEKIKDIKIDKIISSPLKRAYRTAEIINEKFNLDIETDTRLAERNYGVNEGEYTKDFAYNDFWSYTKHVSVEEAEEIEEFFQRVNEFLSELKNKNEYENILLVAHNGVGRAINYYFNDMTDEEIIKFILPNGEAVEYEL